MSLTVTGLTRQLATSDLHYTMFEQLGINLVEAMQRGALMEVETLIRGLAPYLVNRYQRDLAQYSIPPFLLPFLSQNESYPDTLSLFYFLRDQGAEGLCLDICEALCHLEDPSQASDLFARLQSNEETLNAVQKMGEKHPELIEYLDRLLCYLKGEKDPHPGQLNR